MFARKTDLFETNDPKYLEFRREMGLVVKLMNTVASNPFSEKEIRERVFEFTPIHWSVEQIYLLFEYVVLKHNIHNYVFIIQDEKNVIQDFFFIGMKEHKIKQNRTIVQFSQEFIPTGPKNQSFIQRLNAEIIDRNPIQKMVNDYIKGALNSDVSQIFIFPYFIKDILAGLQLPPINVNALELYTIINEIYCQSGIVNNSKMKFFLNLFDENKLINRVFRNLFSEMDSKDLENWAQIWAEILDELSMNFVIILNRKPTICGKIYSHQGKIAINPIPIYHLNKLIAEKADPKQIADQIFHRTGVRTVVIEEEAILKFFNSYADYKRPYKPFETLTQFCFLIYSSAWKPDSLLNSVLKLFGYELGSNMYKIPEAIQKVFRYFEHILFVTFQPEPKTKKTIGTVVEMGIFEENSDLKYIENSPIRDILGDESISKVDRLGKIKEKIEQITGVQYSIVLGFDIEKIADIISARNLQAFLGISNMASQLPLLASVGGFFTSIKALGLETEKDTILKLSNNPPTEEKASPVTMEVMKFYEDFLREGILCILDEKKKTMMKIRAPLYSKQGYLGLDLEKIRELIQKRATT